MQSASVVYPLNIFFAMQKFGLCPALITREANIFFSGGNVARTGIVYFLRTGPYPDIRGALEAVSDCLRKNDS